jgi:predicted DNA-binding protein
LPAGAFDINIAREFSLDTVRQKCYTYPRRRRAMPTKNPRVNIVVEPPLYSVMHDLATSEGVSMSTIARDLIREAIDLREDVALAAFADTRMKTFDRKKALSHEDVWE